MQSKQERVSYFLGSDLKKIIIIIFHIFGNNTTTRQLIVQVVLTFVVNKCIRAVGWCIRKQEIFMHLVLPFLRKQKKQHSDEMYFVFVPCQKLLQTLIFYRKYLYTENYACSYAIRQN